ncbi:MAG: hypothetical protein V1725_07965 [archaeon]
MAEKERKVEDASIKAFKARVKKKLEQELGKTHEDEAISREYEEFRKTYAPLHHSLYEKWCNIAEKIMPIQPDKKELPELEEAIGICHLNITPTGVKSFAILFPTLFIMLSVLFGYAIPYVLTQGEFSSMFFVGFGVLVGLIMIMPLSKMAYFLANNWRMKASNQMVLCVFYVVTYMRHSSNLENAIGFAAEHLAPPMSLDMKKVLWNVETEKFDSVKESLDTYLDSWKKWNMEFIESMHLIESSLYEPEEGRRLNALDKSLSVILDETYERMLHYAHNLKGPLTTLHMMGIILPILGLVVLPLLVSFMEGVAWYHIFTLYNILLPIGVFYLAKVILSTRPTGYGESDISEDNPELKKYRNVGVKLGDIELRINPLFFSIIVFLVLFAIGISPLIIHAANPKHDLAMVDGELVVITEYTDPKATFYFLGYRLDDATEQEIGPFGLGAGILGMFVPLSIGLSIGLYFKLRSQNVIKIRENAKRLEEEFASALFQLGNRLGDGMPVEIAVTKVAKVMEGTVSGDFFRLTSNNITTLGYNIEQAIFDPQHGSLTSYPSSLIESSMKVLTESIRKGPLVASQALINVSQYIKEMHRVDERLKDLMADIISSMKSQISFLTPAIAGIVVGITSMITTILGDLSTKMKLLTAQQSDNVAGASLLGMFGNGVPMFYFQIIVGLYVVQIVYLLTILINGIQNGADPLSEKYMLGQNMIMSSILYTVLALIVSLIFNFVAGTIMSTIVVG